MISTPNATGDQGVQFSTRGSLDGVAALTNLSDTFEIIDSLPDGETFRFMDFSTIRLRASQPIHTDSAIYGVTVSLRDSGGELVPATLLVKDNMITVDPCTTEAMRKCGSPDDQLNPDETYTLSITGLTNLEGETLDYETTFQPKETGPTEILYQEIVDSNFSQQSILNGQYVNAVTLNSVLQGKAGPSQQTGALYAELGYAPSFPGDTPVPLRVPKGTILESSSLDVLVNGSVPVLDAATGEFQKTGTIKVTMTSDAVGYLYPNPYSDSGEAPRHVRLWMDVSMNTEEAQPNAALSQDLLRVELTGLAIVRDGILTIDAIGMVEPNLLGQEFTDSTIAFRIEADTSEQDTAPERPMDVTGPELVSWMPGPVDAIPATRQAMQRPGDPIILNFDEPLDRDSVPNGFTLFADGTEVTNLRIRLDGTAVVLNPEGGLQHGVDYSLNIESALMDLAGNGAFAQTLTFALPQTENGTAIPQRSPFALSTYPGYPCVTEGLDLANGVHGYCKDAAGENLPNDGDGNSQSRDILPVTTMPTNRPIVVVFSQSMDLASIRLDETFIVEKVSDASTPVGSGERVAGRLEKNNQRIRFYPDEPWQVDRLYRYTMVSAQDGDCATVMCGENGMAFQTDLLLDPEDNGGEPLTIYFRGHEQLSSVYTPLRNLPIRDANSNYTIEEFETYNFETARGEGGEPLAHFRTPPNAARLAMNGNATVLGNDGSPDDANARVGCSYEGDECWEEKYIYQTYGLNTEVVGPEIDPVTGEPTGNVRVLLYPTMLVTSPATVWYNLLGPSESETGPQILRMRYQEPTEDNPLGLIESRIVRGENGGTYYEVDADLLLDAPNLHLPIEGLLAHNLFSYPFTLELEGPITFFDDGRMQVALHNTNTPLINVDVAGSSSASTGLLGFVSCLGSIFTGGGISACEELADGNGKAVKLPLKIPPEGVYLNFISNPVKEIPEEG